MQDYHKFASGLLIRKSDLGDGRIQRYTTRGAVNLHEPVEETWFVGALRGLSGGSFLDIGAAVGYYSILARKLRKDIAVHAFELLEDHRSAISENLRINGLREDSIRIHHTAIAPNEGTISFMERSYGSSILPKDGSNHASYFRGYFAKWHDIDALDGNPSVKTIPAMPLQRAISELGTQPILVKIDVQGAEASLLGSVKEALSSELVSYWIIGTHTEELHHEVVGLLSPWTEIEHNEFEVTQQPDGLVVARAPHAKPIVPANVPNDYSMGPRSLWSTIRDSIARRLP